MFINFLDDISTSICVQLGHVLFETWLHACGIGQFPSPSYWKTLRTMTQRWRHHSPIVETWARKVLALNLNVVRQLYGGDYAAGIAIGE